MYQIYIKPYQCIRVALVVVNTYDFVDAKRDSRGYMWVSSVIEIESPNELLTTKLSELSDIEMQTLIGGENRMNSGVLFNKFKPLEYAVFDLKRCKRQKHKAGDKFSASIYFYDRNE